MLKKKLCTILILTLTMLTNSLVYANPDQSMKILVNGQTLITDVEPVIINGRTMVPLRAIFDALNTEVEWIEETRTIIGEKDNISISLQLDSTLAQINNNTVELEVPATIVAERTMVPVRFIAESLQADVDWDQSTRTVMITTTDAIDVPANNSNTTNSTSNNNNTPNVVRTQGTFVGSIQSDKFHKPTCRFVSREGEVERIMTILPENEIWFISVEEATAMGYEPCSVCNPLSEF